MYEDDFLEMQYEDRFIADTDIDESDDEDGSEHDCTDWDRPCDSCLTRNLPSFNGE